MSRTAWLHMTCTIVWQCIILFPCSRYCPIRFVIPAWQAPVAQGKSLIHQCCASKRPKAKGCAKETSSCHVRPAAQAATNATEANESGLLSNAAEGMHEATASFGQSGGAKGRDNARAAAQSQRKRVSPPTCDENGVSHDNDHDPEFVPPVRKRKRVIGTPESFQLAPFEVIQGHLGYINPSVAPYRRRDDRRRKRSKNAVMSHEDAGFLPADVIDDVRESLVIGDDESLLRMILERAMPPRIPLQPVYDFDYDQNDSKGNIDPSMPPRDAAHPWRH